MTRGRRSVASGYVAEERRRALEEYADLCAAFRDVRAEIVAMLPEAARRLDDLSDLALVRLVADTARSPAFRAEATKVTREGDAIAAACRLLAQSWGPLDFDYGSLTPSERMVISESEHATLVALIARYVVVGRGRKERRR